MGHEVWEVSEAYEAYVGRWSRPVAREFVRWLAVPAGRSWLDVGCGPGALTSAALGTAPGRVLGVDRSPGFLSGARSRTAGSRAAFVAGDACALPLPDGRFDVVVSGLCLNFVPDPRRAAAEFARVVAPAPGYVATLSEAGRAALRDLLRSRLPTQPDGSIRLTARAWAIRGTCR